MGLPGRGTTFFRRIEGPPGAPTVMLLHGWTASGGMNYFKAFDELSKHFSIVAPDLRGHGRGIRSWRRFRLADCADDTAALIRELDCRPVIAAAALVTFGGGAFFGLIAGLIAEAIRVRIARRRPRHEL